jgi:hypothetical protein
MLPETCAFIFSPKKCLQGIFLKTHFRNVCPQGTRESTVYTDELWDRTITEQIYYISNKSRFLLEME